jgi:hypothetical protein
VNHYLTDVKEHENLSTETHSHLFQLTNLQLPDLFLVLQI